MKGTLMWIVLALLTAVFTSLKDLCGRKALEKVDYRIVAWSWVTFSVPVLAFLLYQSGIPRLAPEFWPAVIVSSIILTVSSLLFFKAIHETDLSLCVPMLAFTPLLMLVTSPVILGEWPNAFGTVGIVLIVAGFYALHVQMRAVSYWEPVRQLWIDRGTRKMLIVAFLFSIGANVDKIGVESSSAIMWIFTVNSVVSAALAAVMLWQVDHVLHRFRRAPVLLILMGVLTAIALAFQMHAIQLTLVAYVIAIKRMSIILTAGFGFLIFKEQGFKQRFIGSLLMIAGVVLISFLGKG